MIPEEAPLTNDVDFKTLGRKYELSGGNIKSAVFSFDTHNGLQSADYTFLEYLFIVFFRLTK